jgi:hypothetical protein
VPGEHFDSASAALAVAEAFAEELVGEC